MSDKSSNLATLASVIKTGIESHIKDLHTAMPGIVESFNASTQLATVQPALKRIFKTVNADVEMLIPTSLPLLINVPVQYPRGGGFSLTFPVKKGDECLLVFCERSIDNWHQFGGVKKPGGRRFHSLSDAVAFVGLSSIPNKIANYSTTDVELKKDDGAAKVVLKEDTGVRLENSNGFVELQPDGLFNINGIIFEQHVHPQDQDSGGNTEQNTGVPE